MRRTVRNVAPRVTARSAIPSTGVAERRSVDMLERIAFLGLLLVLWTLGLAFGVAGNLIHVLLAVALVLLVVQALQARKTAH